MDTEEGIYNEFKNGDLSYIDAIERLQKFNYTPIEAEELVSEWADTLDNNCNNT